MADPYYIRLEDPTGLHVNVLSSSKILLESAKVQMRLEKVVAEKREVKQRLQQQLQQITQVVARLQEELPHNELLKEFKEQQARPKPRPKPKPQPAPKPKPQPKPKSTDEKLDDAIAEIERKLSQLG